MRSGANGVAVHRAFNIINPQPNCMKTDYYEQAQAAIAMLKSAIHGLLSDPSTSSEGLRNAEIGRELGIYRVHLDPKQQSGHISRSILKLMEFDEVVEYNERTHLWSLRDI